MVPGRVGRWAAGGATHAHGRGRCKKTNMEESEYGGLGRAEAQAKWEEWERLKEQNSAAAPFSDNSGPTGELCFWIRKPKQVFRFTSETQVVISCECPQTRFPVFFVVTFHLCFMLYFHACGFVLCGIFAPCDTRDYQRGPRVSPRRSRSGTQRPAIKSLARSRKRRSRVRRRNSWRVCGRIAQQRLCEIPCL